MSICHEFFIATELKIDTSQQVLDTLTYLATNKSFEPKILPQIIPDHFFFGMESWEWVIGNTDDSISGEGFACLTLNNSSNQYQLTIRVWICKGYNLIAAFLHWLTPYTDHEGFAGYIVSDEMPFSVTLILFKMLVTRHLPTTGMKVRH